MEEIKLTLEFRSGDDVRQNWFRLRTASTTVFEGYERDLDIMQRSIVKECLAAHAESIAKFGKSIATK